MKPTASVIIIMGVTGAGKTTVGRQLAADAGWHFHDGDEFHPPENLRKMAGGVPLNDEDRVIWLERQRAALTEWITAGARVVLASSLLKAAHREIVFGSYTQEIGLVYLKANPGQLEHRLRARKGHFMKEGLLPSQLEILEEPVNALVLDATESLPNLSKHIRSVFGL